MTIKIATAAYALDWTPDWGAYAAKISDWVANAAGDGAQLLVFPEYAAMELAGLAGEAAAADIRGSIEAVSSRY
jgi:predicted amidohydrolase